MTRRGRAMLGRVFNTVSAVVTKAALLALLCRGEALAVPFRAFRLPTAAPHGLGFRIARLIRLFQIPAALAKTPFVAIPIVFVANAVLFAALRALAVARVGEFVQLGGSTPSFGKEGSAAAVGESPGNLEARDASLEPQPPLAHALSRTRDGKVELVGKGVPGTGHQGE